MLQVQEFSQNPELCGSDIYVPDGGRVTENKFRRWMILASQPSVSTWSWTQCDCSLGLGVGLSFEARAERVLALAEVRNCGFCAARRRHEASFLWRACCNCPRTAGCTKCLLLELSCCHAGRLHFRLLPCVRQHARR